MLRRALERFFGRDWSQLEDEQLRLAMRIILGTQINALRLMALETESLTERLASALVDRPEEGGCDDPILEQVRSLRLLKARLKELADSTEVKVGGLEPSQRGGERLDSEKDLFEVN